MIFYDKDKHIFIGWNFNENDLYCTIKKTEDTVKDLTVKEIWSMVVLPRHETRDKHEGWLGNILVLVTGSDFTWSQGYMITYFYQNSLNDILNMDILHYKFYLHDVFYYKKTKYLA